MKILIFSYLHPSVMPGGAQQVAHELFLSLSLLGHQVYMVSSIYSEQAALLEVPRTTFFLLPGSKKEFMFIPLNFDHSNFTISSFGSVEQIFTLVKTISPDVIHFHHYLGFGFEVINASKLAAPKAIMCLTFHEMMAICHANGQMVKARSQELCLKANPKDCALCFPQYGERFFLDRDRRVRNSLRVFDLYFFPSNFLRGRYVDWGLLEKKCFVVQNGQLDTSVSALNNICSEHLNKFGFFGQYLDNKGLMVILSSLLQIIHQDLMPDEGIVFEINAANKIYATESYRNACDDAISIIRQRSRGKVQIIERGPYSRAELAGRMSAVDWVIVPSTWWEVFGLVVSEAWMNGRVVIASDIAGLAERIEDKVNGYLFPVGDCSSLAALMLRLVGNRKAWSEIRGRAPTVMSSIEMAREHVRLWTGDEGLYQ